MNGRMAMGNGADEGGAPVEHEEQREWILRAALWIVANWRPYLGWLVIGLCMALTMLPALLIAENTWLRSSALAARLNLLGPLAVAAGWLVSGWRRPWATRPAWLRTMAQVLSFLLLGLLIVSQALGEWLPTPSALWGAGRSGEWSALGGQIVAAWSALIGRYGLWLQGVQENSAARDDLILAGVAGVIIWLLAGATVLLARHTRQGLLAGLPVLWPLGFLMLYSPADRWLFVTGVALVLLLHLVLDQQALVRRWVREGLDYSPSLLIERGLLALSGITLAVTIAALMPNLYIYDLTAGYFEWIQPMNQRMEAVSRRLFPGLAGIVPWGGRGIAGGLPNAFLLGGGSAPGERTVMRVRTNEPYSGYDQPPLGHPLRGATFSDYDGLGWNNPSNLLLTRYEADEAWGELGAPRRPLLQSVNLDFTSGVVYAAGEPQAPSIGYVAQERFPGDLAALTTPRTRSYTVVSQIPALDEAELDALPPWGPANPLPEEYAIYLALSPTVTQRTRDLAAQLTAGAATPYAAANAIEAYLRQIPYDLEIGPLPEGVADVADYFLFDLRRGYCDYYATAFVVLARLAGLPARFVTGFAAGNWSPNEQQWIISEAEAHSWPEVYFPQVGWVRFEPTAYRPQPVRIGLSQSLALSETPTLEPPTPAERPWLPLWWAALVALPLLALAWGVISWQSRHEDPWLGLLRWGRRAGRPLQEGETALEYGDSLAAHVQERRAKEPEMGRTAAREVQSLSREVSAAQYGPLDERPSLRQQAAARWVRLRQYLRKL